jgi:hypothetical protein
MSVMIQADVSTRSVERRDVETNLSVCRQEVVEQIGSMQQPGRAEMLMLIRKRNAQACRIGASAHVSA